MVFRCRLQRVHYLFLIMSNSTLRRIGDVLSLPEWFTRETTGRLSFDEVEQLFNSGVRMIACGYPFDGTNPFHHVAVGVVLVVKPVERIIFFQFFAGNAVTVRDTNTVRFADYLDLHLYRLDGVLDPATNIHAMTQAALTMRNGNILQPPLADNANIRGLFRDIQSCQVRNVWQPGPECRNPLYSIGQPLVPVPRMEVNALHSATHAEMRERFERDGVTAYVWVGPYAEDCDFMRVVRVGVVLGVRESGVIFQRSMDSEPFILEDPGDSRLLPQYRLFRFDAPLNHTAGQLAAMQSIALIGPLRTGDIHALPRIRDDNLARAVVWLQPRDILGSHRPFHDIAPAMGLARSNVGLPVHQDVEEEIRTQTDRQLALLTTQ
jgi:hypothetical protein